ncbi:outer membrane protein assembly factor BamB family protein [Haladaptatus cibarius]|uniref:outer membrane protein assembly factor BamB family protein n=1 Tax=Haladaptatus cibarius TaxID=453847 RepID=UPI000678B9C2|nr:PQQ-binding-like beta-propeller repeat protein [Haladaptatus cibarius]
MIDDEVSNGGWSRRRAIAAVGGMVAVGGCLTESKPGQSPPAQDTTPESEDEEDSSASDSWPCFGYDAGNRGSAPAASGPTQNPQVEWTFDAGTPTMNSSPVVLEDVVYTTGTGDPGGIRAVETSSGKQVWKFDTDGYVSSAPAVVDGVLYAGTWGKQFYAVDIESGNQRWTVDVGHRFSSSSPVVADGRIFVGTIGDGPLVVSGPEDEEKFEACALFAFDAETGNELWRYDDFGERDHIESSPAVADGRVHFTGENAVYALDVETGEVVWSRNIVGSSYASPAVGDELVYYAAPYRGDSPSRLWALNAETGETRWTYGLGNTSQKISPAVADGTVYVPASSSRVCLLSGGSDDDNCSGVTRGRLYAVDAKAGTERWKAEIKTDTRSSPAVADGVVYVGCRNGVSAVTVDGENAWRLDFEGEREDSPYVESSPAVAAGRVFIGASDGQLRSISEE